jgi:hypothetical protein
MLILHDRNCYIMSWTWEKEGNIVAAGGTDTVLPASNFLAFRPGDLLSIVVHEVTGVRPCINCLDHIEVMNQWGWWRCWLNRKTISSWLSEEARSRGHEISESAALGLVRVAFKELSNRKSTGSKPPSQLSNISTLS